MKYISHRGNLNGFNIQLENSPEYINAALKKGYDVEIDVWVFSNKLYLGHDIPQYEVSRDFIQKELWCHAKNYMALEYLLDINAHCFWHQKDTFTLTSKGYIWAYPCMYYKSNCIAVLPERNNVQDVDCLGICSDFISKYKEKNNG